MSRIGIFGTSCSARWRAPTKLTFIVSSSENGGPGRPAQLKRPSTGSVDRCGCCLDRRSIAEVHLDRPGYGYDGRVDVDRRHVGAEVDEDLRGGGPHPRCGAGDDHRSTLVSQHVVHRLAFKMVTTIFARGSEMSKDSSTIAKATRRPRGAPRTLLLDAARTLFARQDYRSTTTKEIAEEAGVLEHLLFRHFGSKAALFNQAVVVPFMQIIDDFSSRWESLVPRPESAEAVGREFLGALYDLFLENRGLLMTLWAADALTEDELADTGIADIDSAIAILGQLGGKGLDILGIHANHQDLAARSNVAMVAGMAAFGATFFGGTRPPRDVIVEELTQATLHGFLHRGS